MEKAIRNSKVTQYTVHDGGLQYQILFSTPGIILVDLNTDTPYLLLDNEVHYADTRKQLVRHGYNPNTADSLATSFLDTLHEVGFIQ